MSIQPIEPNRDNSPWYKIMEDKAIAWNRFAERNNLIIEGYYNAYSVDFTIKNNDNSLVVVGMRQLSDARNYLIPFDSVFTEYLKVKVYSKVGYSKYVKIIKKNIFNRFKSKLKIKNFDYKEYLISYNSQLAFQKVQELGALEDKKLVFLKRDKHKGELLLNVLPKSSIEIDKYLSLLMDLLK